MSLTTMTTVLSVPTPARTLIPGGLFDRLTGRIAREELIERDLAERVMDQALAFLAASAHHAGEPLVPSDLVDIGWHTFILYTREYAEFRDRLAGRFIHHVPDDAPDAPTEKASPADVRTRTLDAIVRAGYAIDHELWTLTAGTCGSCHDDGNCSASGKDGTENTDTRKK